MNTFDVEVNAEGEESYLPAAWPVMNASGLPDEMVRDAAQVRELASKLSKWVDNARSAAGRTSANDAGAYTPPNNVYDEMAAARHAMEFDDIVSGVYDITEAFAFQGVKWEGISSADADIFNQISRDLDLDTMIRAMWWEEYSINQFVCAMRWGWKEYKVRGKTRRGNKKKTVKRVWCPTSLHTIDTRKVVPIGHGPLGSQGLAWNSTKDEIDHYNSVVSGDVIDPELLEFYMGLYRPGPDEKALLTRWGVDPENLMRLNPRLVWRHTSTKPSYRPHPPVRLRSVFHLLDMKRQLILSDRAALIGSANYILLVRKGLKDEPAHPEELANLHERYNFIAKMPVIISDHRLSIDIIAPKTDFVLQGEKYNTLDNRILSRLLGTLTISQQGQRNETNITLSRAVAKSMEDRRHMIRRDLEKHIARAVVKHPNNHGVFEDEPNLVYVPRTIALDVDQAMVQALMNLRTMREVSRETILEHFGLDQETEALRVELEAERYDDIFKTVVPFSGGGNSFVNGGTGAQGGRPVGGGDSPQNPAKPKDQTEGGNPSTK